MYCTWQSAPKETVKIKTWKKIYWMTSSLSATQQQIRRFGPLVLCYGMRVISPWDKRTHTHTPQETLKVLWFYCSAWERRGSSKMRSQVENIPVKWVIPLWLHNTTITVSSIRVGFAYCTYKDYSTLPCYVLQCWRSTWLHVEAKSKPAGLPQQWLQRVMQ